MQLWLCAAVVLDFLALGMRWASGLNSSGLGNVAISSPPGTLSMAAILWRVQRRRSACGFNLRNWWITRVVHRTGSTSDRRASHHALLIYFPPFPWARARLANLVISGTSL